MSINPPAPPADDASSNNSLSLVAPAPVGDVSDAQAVEMIKLDQATAGKIDSIVSQYLESLIALDPHSQDFADKLTAIHAMGDREMRESASVSNRLLDKPVKAMESGGLSQGASVSRSLVDLRRTVEDLDPSRQNLLSPRRLLGVIPFGNRIRDYFARYRSAQGHLNAIIQALYRGQDELRKDNAAIQQEELNVWDLKGRLEQYVYMATQLDAALSAQLQRVAQTDPGRAKQLREDVLFYLRQKRQDLVTQLAVNAQGHLALELVRKSNLELIKGVDRATTTTLSALRTAVIVAQALTNQRLVLDQVSALNVTTGNLIESTSQRLKEQTAEVHQRAADAAISVEKLQAAFANVYTAIDSIDRYKLQALDSMQKTIDALSGEVARAQAYLKQAPTARLSEAAAGGRGGELELGPGPAA